MKKGLNPLFFHTCAGKTCLRVSLPLSGRPAIDYLMIVHEYLVQTRTGEGI